MTVSWLVATLLVPPFFLVALALFIWRRRSDRNGLELIALLLAVALWGLTSAGEKFFTDLDIKIWIAKIQYIGIVAVAPGCLAVALSSRGDPHHRVMRWVTQLSVPCVGVLGLVMTNEWHQLFWHSARVEVAAGIPILKVGYGPGFWFHVAWAYSLLAGAVALMISKWARSWSYYRGEAVWVLFGMAAPITANLVYLSRAGSAANFDLTPAAFSITAFCLGWPLIFRDGLFDVVRLAKREIFDHMADGAIVVDLRDRLIYINVSACRILGLSDVRIPCPMGDALDDYPDLLASDADSEGEAREIEIDVDGTKRTFDLAVTGLRDPRGRLISRLVVLRDVTARKIAVERIRASEDGLRKVIDVVPHLIYVKDEFGRFLLVNQATADSMGMQPDQLVGCDLSEMNLPPALVAKVNATDYEVINRRERRSLTERVATGNGSTVVFQTTKIPFTFPQTGTPALLGISIDVTERIRDDEKIRRLAFFDSLTGLPNRRRFLERLGRALSTAKRKQTRFSVLFLDLDRFKDVNDRLGHGPGDELLREVSTRLQDSVRFSDHLAFSEPGTRSEAVSRLAGDEFTILLTNISDSTDGARVAQRILEAISKPFEIAGESVLMRMSIGMASYPEDGDDIDTLMRCADQAMYEAKRNRQGFAFFDPSTTARAARRHQIESELRRALDADEFQIRFQPIRNAMTGRVSGVEALIHWTNEQLGSIGPNEFIPIAEETGLIHEMGDRMMRLTCEWLRSWKAEGFDVPCVSVNVSTVQLRERSFVAGFARSLEESGIGIGEIELEVSEGTTLATDESAHQTLLALGEMGARLSLDDFGTGSSSIRNLRCFDFRRIKIGPSFVGALPESHDDAILASGIVAMAHGLGISVVAVGVETESQVECLRAMECDELQGFLLSRPLPPDEFRTFLEAEKPEV